MLKVSFIRSLDANKLRYWQLIVAKVANINTNEESDNFLWRLHENGVSSLSQCTIFSIMAWRFPRKLVYKVTTKKYYFRVFF
jgi:hypothetical protein